VFLAVLTILLVPFHEAGDISKYRFETMQFSWQTNPRDHLLPLDPAYHDYNVLLDGHAHTTVSDGKLQPEQLVEYAIAQGFNAMIVTDHNTVVGGLRAEEYAQQKYPGSFIVIPGMEYSTCRIHMNFININTTVTAGNTAFPTDNDIRLAINRAHELGGLVIVNHIPWSNHTLERLGAPRLPNHPSIQSLVDWGVDGFEIANQATFDMPTYQYVTGQNAASGRATEGGPARLILMAGSDVHTPGPAFAWTVLKSPSFTKEAIVDEIRNARTSLLFDPAGSPVHGAPEYSRHYMALLPLSELAQYFGSFYDRYQGQYSFHNSHCQSEIVDVHAISIGCFVLYFISAVVLFEII
ncbi:PHP domain-like protein, partial [Martensiomyces pterosporus]